MNIRILFICLLFWVMQAWALPEVQSNTSSQTVTIQFPEPVVSVSVVDAAQDAPPSARGLHLFRIEGDAAHCPQAEWTDQDTLRLSFPEGTNANTEYRLVFQPGTCYLGGKSLPAAPIRFRCPLTELDAFETVTEHGWGLVVTPARTTTRQALNFSTQTAVHYEFGQVKQRFWSNESYIARRVPAVVSPAKLCHGVETEGLKRLYAMGNKTWGTLKETSLLPGHVWVRPAEELSPDETWVLVYTGAEKSGISHGSFGPHAPQNDLQTGVSMLPPAKNATEVEVLVHFSHPVPESALPDLFARLGFSIDGEGAVTATEDGRTRTLRVDDKVWLQFRYMGGLPCERKTWKLEKDGEKEPDMLAYRSVGVVSGLRMRVSGALPAEVDIAIPEGLRASGGATVREPHVHRISLNPVPPQFGVSDDGVCIVPLHGSHAIQLPAVNMGTVDVILRRVDDAKAPQVYFNPRYDTRDLAYGRYVYNTAILRARKDLFNSTSRATMKRALDRLEEDLDKARSLRKQWLETAQRFRTHRFEFSKNGMLRHTNLTLNLDALSEGKLRPGLYVITVISRANQQVRYAMQLQRQHPDFLSFEFDIPVLVTDLNMVCAREGVLVTRFSDGSVVSGAAISGYRTDSDSSAQPVALSKNGVYFGHFAHNKVMARAGADAAYASVYITYDSEKKDKNYCMVVMDRPMYRPGDTVHVRGYVRNMVQGRAHHYAAPSVSLNVFKPAGGKLSEQQVSLGKYGAFAADIVLPEGEEDVTGNYTLRIEGEDLEHCTEIKCQVFRRDAFAALLKADVAKVAPQEIRLSVQADDYSGVPLCGAGVKLTVAFANEKEIHRELLTDANGHVECVLPLSAEQVRAGALTVSGSVSNDREEYVNLPPQRLEFSPADFCIDLRKGCVVLTDALTGKVLDSARTIKVSVEDSGYAQPAANLRFSVLKPTVKTLSEAEITVPGGCADGVPMPEHILKYLVANENNDRAKLIISGADALGRESVCHMSVETFMEQAAESELQLKIEHHEGKLLGSVYAPHAGMGHLILASRNGMRHLSRHMVQGYNEFDVPLRKGEDGEVALSVVLLRTGAAPDPAQVFDESATCHIPVPAQHLDVQVQVPTAPVRPGQTVQISGTVTADGAPADAEVTLYAVDAGMLSVAEYKTPDPERYFAFDSADSFTYFSAYDTMSKRPLSYAAINGVWQGDMLRGESLSLTPAEESDDLLSVPYPVADGEIPPWLLDEGDGLMTGGLRSGTKSLNHTFMEDLVKRAETETLAPAVCYCIGEEAAPDTAPVLRSNFEPVAVWKAALKTDAQGRFCTEAQLPDTLTTYRLFAVAASRSGKRFGVAEQAFTVNLPVMLTPGMPLFMSVGDSLKLPLSVVNNTDSAADLQVSMQGGESQQVSLPAKGTETLYFDVSPRQEGECSLQWQARGASGADAVQASCQVRYPAPLLKEVHHLVLKEGQSAVQLASLFAENLAQSTRARVQVELSASPLLHLQGCVDYLLDSSYGCTEQRASALMPWLLYDELAPFCPRLAATSREDARKHADKEIAALFARQCEDGGLTFWPGAKVSSPWASAYAAMALTVAAERGVTLPKDKMKRLLRYVDSQELYGFSSKIAALRALGHRRALRRELQKEYEELTKQQERENLRLGVHGANLRFLLALQGKEDALAAFRTWLFTVARDYRHAGSMDSALALLALHDFTRKSVAKQPSAVVQTDSARHVLSKALFSLQLPQVTRPADLPTTLAAVDATVYATVRISAYPEQTEYPGVTEKGLQVTRLYEVQAPDGSWQPAPQELQVGQVVRVTLTCAKVADEHEYLVLEDYLPACMEAINPEVPSQAAGLPDCDCSTLFDRKEYLAHRVRAFCTRWATRDLLNMQYYARVKRAGTSMAPPAHAQLMYEPQTYGLSPNTKVISKP